MDRRGALAIAVLALAVGLVAVLVSQEPGASPGDGAIDVTVVFADGDVANGTFILDDATAFSALQAIADDRGWSLSFTGRGEDLFVTEVRGDANAGAAGWCYAVWDGAAFVQPAYGAGVAGLRDGDRVRWSYQANGCRLG